MIISTSIMYLAEVFNKLAGELPNYGTEKYIVSYNFENYPIGPITSNKICSSMKTFSIKNGGICIFKGELEIVRDKNQGKVLRVYKPDEQLHEKYIFKLHSGYFSEKKHMRVSIWFRFSDGFDLGKGGKLPGGIIGQVRGSTRPTGGNNVRNDNGFSVRSMYYTPHHGRKKYKSYDTLYSYIYHEDMPGKYGDREQYILNDHRVDIKRVSKEQTSKALYVKEGYHLITEVKVNDKQSHNGRVTIKLNNEVVINRNNYMFTKSGRNMINKVTFSFFFGGSRDWVPSNINQSKLEYIDIDEIEVIELINK